MNALERFVYDRLKNNPTYKDYIKNIYQGLFSLLNISDRETSINPITVRENAYFGFHDKSPWSADNKYLLGHGFTGAGNESINNYLSQEILIYLNEDWREKKVIDTTKAWNWQQGSQLQWVGESEQVVFNTFNQGKCQAKIQDVETKEYVFLPFPVSAVSRSGDKFASICFRTFGTVMHGYGYNFDEFGQLSEAYPERLIVFNQHGETFYDIDTSDIEFGEWSLNSNYKQNVCISHCLFSPGGKYVTFMKRVQPPGSRLKSKLLTLNLLTGGIDILPFHDMVSHYCFCDDYRILAYGNTLKDGDGYYFVNVETKEMENVTSMINNVDGHPHASVATHQIVFDTYPNRVRNQSLFEINIDTQTVRSLARLYSPHKFRGSFRVDLHPRIRQDGKYVCFDSSHTGTRSLCTMPLQ